MHTDAPAILTDIRLGRFSAQGDGMHVELSSPATRSTPLLTFRHDEALGLQVVIHAGDPGDPDVSMSLQDLERAIAFAKAEVRNEASYDPPQGN